MKWYYYIITIIIFSILFLAFVELGMTFTQAGLYTLGIAIIIIIIWFLNKWRSGEGFFEEKRGRKRKEININQAKFIVAKYLRDYHDVDLFTYGNDPDTAQYSVNMVASQVYPQGEQVWIVKMVVLDDRYFNRKTTRIVYYVGGNGRIIDEHILNDLLGLHGEIWRDPEHFFLKGVSKTPKKLSMQDIISKHVERTGEFPEVPKELYDMERKDED